MAVTINKHFWNGTSYSDIAKIVYTSPNFDSPAIAGTRSHAQPGGKYIGTWYEAVDFMYKQKENQDYFNGRESMESFFGYLELTDDFDFERDSSARFKTEYNSDYYLNDSIDYIYEDKNNYAKISTSESFLTVSGIDITYLVPDHTYNFSFDNTNTVWWNSYGLNNDELLDIYIAYNGEDEWHLLANDIRNTGSFSFVTDYIKSKGFIEVDTNETCYNIELLPAKEVYRGLINEDDALVQKGFATLSAIMQINANSDFDEFYSFHYKNSLDNDYIATDSVAIVDSTTAIIVYIELADLEPSAEYDFKFVCTSISHDNIETEVKHFTIDSQYKITYESYVCQAKLKISYLSAYDSFSESFYMKEPSFTSGTAPVPEITYSPEVLEVPYSAGTPYQPYIPPSGDRVDSEVVLSAFTGDYSSQTDVYFDKTSENLYRCSGDSLYVFDSALNKWTFITSLPFSGTEQQLVGIDISMVAKNNIIYIFCVYPSVFYKYDVVGNLWTKLSDIPTSFLDISVDADIRHVNLASIDESDGKLFAKVLGEDNLYSPTYNLANAIYGVFDSCYVYTYYIDTDDWEELVQLDTPSRVGVSDTTLLLDDVISTRDSNLTSSTQTGLLMDSTTSGTYDRFLGPISYSSTGVTASGVTNLGVIYRHESTGLYIFSNESNLWEKVSNSPIPISDALIYVDDIVYLIVDLDLYSFDPDTNMWEQLRSISSEYAGVRGQKLYYFDDSPGEIYFISTSTLENSPDPTVFFNKYIIATGYWESILDIPLLDEGIFITSPSTSIVTDKILPFATLYKDGVDADSIYAVNLLQGRGMFSKKMPNNTYSSDIVVGGTLDSSFSDIVSYDVSITVGADAYLDVIKEASNVYTGAAVVTGELNTANLGEVTYSISIEHLVDGHLTLEKSINNTYASDTSAAGVLDDVALGEVIYAVSIFGGAVGYLTTIPSQANPYSGIMEVDGELDSSIETAATYSISVDKRTDAYLTSTKAPSNTFSGDIELFGALDIEEDTDVVWLISTKAAFAGSYAVERSTEFINSSILVSVECTSVDTIINDIVYVFSLNANGIVKTTFPQTYNDGITWTSTGGDNSSGDIYLSNSTYSVGDYGLEITIAGWDDGMADYPNAFAITFSSARPPSMTWIASNGENSTGDVILRYNTLQYSINSGVLVKFSSATLASMTSDCPSAWTVTADCDRAPKISWTSSIGDDSSSAVSITFPDHWYDLGTKGLQMRFSTSTISSMTTDSNGAWSVSTCRDTSPYMSWISSADDHSTTNVDLILPDSPYDLGDHGLTLSFSSTALASMTSDCEDAWIVSSALEVPPSMTWTSSALDHSLDPVFLEFGSYVYDLGSYGLQIMFSSETLNSMTTDSDGAWSVVTSLVVPPSMSWLSTGDSDSDSNVALVLDNVGYALGNYGLEVMFSATTLTSMTTSIDSAWEISVGQFECLGISKISLNAGSVTNLVADNKNLLSLYTPSNGELLGWQETDYSGASTVIDSDEAEFLIVVTQTWSDGVHSDAHDYKFIRGKANSDFNPVCDVFNTDLGIISTEYGLIYSDQTMTKFRNTLGPVDLDKDHFPTKIRLTCDEKFIYMYASLDEDQSFYDKYFYRVPFRQAVLDNATIDYGPVPLPGAYNIVNNIILSYANSLYSIGRTSGTVLISAISDNTNYTCSLSDFSTFSQKSFFGPVTNSSGPYTFEENFVSNTVFDPLNNKIYLIGGNDTYNFGAINFVDTSYSKLSDVPWLLKDGNTAEIIDGFIYIVQGADSSAFSRYSIALDSWELLESLPPSIEAEWPILCSSNNTEYLYLVNNFDESLYVYTIATNQWDIIENILFDYTGATTNTYFKDYFKRYNMLYFFINQDSTGGFNIFSLNVDTLEVVGIPGRLPTMSYTGSQDQLNNVFYKSNLIFTSVNYDLNDVSNSLLFCSNLYLDYSEVSPLFMTYEDVSRELMEPILFFGDSSDYVYSLSVFGTFGQICDSIIIKRIEVATGDILILGTSAIKFTSVVDDESSIYDIFYNTVSGDIVKVSDTKFEFMLAASTNYGVPYDEVVPNAVVCFRGVLDFSVDFLSFEFTPVNIDPVYYGIGGSVPVVSHSGATYSNVVVTSDSNFFYTATFDPTDDVVTNSFYRLTLKTAYDAGTTCSGVAYLPWYTDGSVFVSATSTDDAYVYALGGNASSYLYRLATTGEVDFSVAYPSGSVFGAVTALSDGPYIFDKNMLNNILLDTSLDIMYLLGDRFISVGTSSNTYVELSYPNFDFTDDFSFTILAGNIYLSPGIPSNVVYKYSISGDSWSQVTPFPTSFVGKNVICKAEDTYLYLFNSNDRDMYRYNTTADSWAIVTNYFEGGNQCPEISTLNSMYKDGNIYFAVTSELIKFNVASMTGEYYYNYNYSDQASPCVVGNNIYTNIGNSLVRQNLEYSQSDPIDEVVEIPEVEYVPYRAEIPYSDYVASTYSGSNYTVQTTSPVSWEFSTDLTSPDSVIMNFDVNFSTIVGTGVVPSGTLMYHQFSGTSITDGSATPINRYHCGENSIIFEATFGEAYDCRLTAWDDDTHSTTDNKILSESHYSVDAAVYRSDSTTQAYNPKFLSERCLVYPPCSDRVLKGNESYYGDFDFIYAVHADDNGEYLAFIPRLSDMDETFTAGNYDFITTLHYQYT